MNRVFGIPYKCFGQGFLANFKVQKEANSNWYRHWFAPGNLIREQADDNTTFSPEAVIILK